MLKGMPPPPRVMLCGGQVQTPSSLVSDWAQSTTNQLINYAAQLLTGLKAPTNQLINYPPQLLTGLKALTNQLTNLRCG